MFLPFKATDPPTTYRCTLVSREQNRRLKCRSGLGKRENNIDSEISRVRTSGESGDALLFSFLFI